ncbi:MAG TPA: ABC transporter permease [Anaerolineaceae bacterium]
MKNSTVRIVRNILDDLWRFLKIMAHNKVGFIGFLGIIGFILLTFVGPYFVPLSMDTQITKIYKPPSAEHILGTDFQGRDIWMQIVHGGKDVLIVAFLTGVISTTIAVTLGSLSAVLSGWFDWIIMWITDIFLTIPNFPLLAVIAVFVKLTNVWALALILSLLAWPSLTRSVRAQVLSLKQRDYVEAARTLDLGIRHIIFSEILPNMMSYIAISLVFSMTSAIYAQVALVFLGLVPFASNNWGVMLSLSWARGALYYKDSLLNIMAPVMAIAFFQLALVWMTRSLEEIFNPRLRTSV